MMSKKILNVISLCGQALMLSFGVVTFAVCYSAFNSLNGAEADSAGEAIGIGFGAIGLVLICIFAVFYSVLALVPFLLKIFRAAGRGRRFDIAAIVFDVLLVFVNILVIIANEEAGGIAALSALLAVNLSCLVLNCITACKE